MGTYLHQGFPVVYSVLGAEDGKVPHASSTVCQLSVPAFKHDQPSQPTWQTSLVTDNSTSPNLLMKICVWGEDDDRV